MEELAKTILLAAKIREESFDHESSEKAQNKKGVDHCVFYKTSLFDACDEAAEQTGYSTRGTYPIYILLKQDWNGIIDWASIVMNKYPTFKKGKTNDDN